MSSDEVTLTVTIKVSRKAWNAEYGCGEAPQQVRDDFGSWLRTTLEGSPAEHVMVGAPAGEPRVPGRVAPPAEP
jgi:hypothetical protein